MGQCRGREKSFGFRALLGGCDYMIVVEACSPGINISIRHHRTKALVESYPKGPST